MDSADVAHRRLHSLRLTTAPLDSPADVVRWLGAVQSQDYPGAKWAVAQRTSDTTDATLDHVFDEGVLLRTHVLRPTWHFVLPEDIRWIQQLTGPRVQARNQLYYRRGGLDEAMLARSESVLAHALESGTHLTRPEMQAVLARADIAVEREALAYVLMSAELNALICSGAVRGKQHTYALVEQRVPATPRRSRDEALAELTRRYFLSHGPATTKDFAWWSSLSAAEIRQGLDLVGSDLGHEVLDGRTYWFDPSPYDRATSPDVHLLQGYDEYFVGHSATKYILDLSGAARAWLSDHRVSFTHGVVLDSQVFGTWQRTLGKESVALNVEVLGRLGEAEERTLLSAVERYGRFMGSVARAAIRCSDE
jgi:DNA glycosylase AlkZ-like